MGVTATGIDRRARTVLCADGTAVAYDALVLATGSRPFVPPVPGRDLPGCFVYRTIDDLDAIRAALRTAAPAGGPAGDTAAAVVVGGGLLGLEAANALRLLGSRPHVVELAPHLLPAQIDAGAARVVARLVGGVGLRVHCGVGTRSIDAGPDGRVCGVTLTDGTAIRTGLVVFSAGIRPRDELATAAGLATAERGGVLVDEACRTADGRIWAVGECAAVHGRCYGLVAPGYRMAEVVAARLLDRGAPVFAGADTSTRLKLFGVEVASFGDAHARTEGAMELVYADHTADTYAKLVLDGQARTLLGGVLAGDARAYTVLRSLVGQDLPAAPERLLESGAA
jgi:nitrite reductase (NADH) large subunit